MISNEVVARTKERSSGWDGGRRWLSDREESGTREPVRGIGIARWISGAAVAWQRTVSTEWIGIGVEMGSGNGLDWSGSGSGSGMGIRSLGLRNELAVETGNGSHSENDLELELAMRRFFFILFFFYYYFYFNSFSTNITR